MPEIPTATLGECGLLATRAAPTEDFTIDSVAGERDQWEQVYDRLIDWGARPECEDEDGYVSPSLRAIASATRLIHQLRGSSSPHHVAPDGEGGIVFERRGDDWAETLEMSIDGSAEYIRFNDGRVVERYPVQLL